MHYRIFRRLHNCCSFLVHMFCLLGEGGNIVHFLFAIKMHCKVEAPSSINDPNFDTYILSSRTTMYFTMTTPYNIIGTENATHWLKGTLYHCSTYSWLTLIFKLQHMYLHPRAPMLPGSALLKYCKYTRACTKRVLFRTSMYKMYVQETYCY